MARLFRKSEPFDPNTQDLARLVRLLGPVGTRLSYDDAIRTVNSKMRFDQQRGFDNGAAPRDPRGGGVAEPGRGRDDTRARGLLAALEWAGLIERVSMRPQLKDGATALSQQPEYDAGVLVVDPPTPADRSIVEEPTVTVYDADGQLVEVKRSKEGEFLNEQRRIQARRRADVLRRDLAELKALEAEGF